MRVWDIKVYSQGESQVRDRKVDEVRIQAVGNWSYRVDEILQGQCRVRF